MTVTSTAPVLQLDRLVKSYPVGNRSRPRTILKEVDYAFDAGRMYSVVGPSGSGKTTLLSLASGLDTPTSGHVRFRGQDIGALGLGAYRQRHAATVFQSLNLITYMTAVQNITSAMEITGVRRGGRWRRAAELLDLLGIEEADRHRRTLQLSGGQGLPTPGPRGRQMRHRRHPLPGPRPRLGRGPDPVPRAPGTGLKTPAQPAMVAAQPTEPISQLVSGPVLRTAVGAGHAPESQLTPAVHHRRGAPPP
ncbi:ATP-binding cassette domain-containing protein [Streptomyces sp. DB-54]